jgi:hypothetical protein
MTAEYIINRPTKLIVNSLTIILTGLMTLMNFSEWYVVKIQERTTEYPFGGEGPTPYYYKTAELYSTVSLIWGLIFLIVFLFTMWTIIKGQTKLTLISFGTTLFLILGLFVNGRIGVN